ncbi:hypothetical protein ACF08B_14675 [Streptomyces sp. NPDC015139]|uniref:hypothetical protein n=1 Tax=Streptomyces sp. NPDC015139 TaxID=3364942 RepID=UPI0036FE52CA
MAWDRLPDRVREFASYLDGLMARLDQGGGWSAVFWQRDPEGMQACLDGREVLPWDVVEALLHDLGAAYGPAAATAERQRARALHTAATGAYDARPGARDALAGRLDAMLGEQRYAAERQAELSRLLSAPASPHEVEALRLDLAWAQDDHDRATARCAELRSRLEELARKPTEGAAARGRRRGGARFAGLAGDEAAAAAVPRTPVPVAEPRGGLRAPRGARFAGAAAEAEPVPVPVEAVDDAAAAAVERAVERLARLRTQGRSGEAHALLVEATGWPAGRLPLLADALHRAGLDADWATLLWESAALPAERLVDAADALAGAGRDADGRQMLRQGVVRPAEQIGAAVLRLAGEGRGREVRALLDAYVRMRTPEEAARSVAEAPDRLVPLLLEAARAVSSERHWDLVHALRVAGHAP